MAVSSDHGGMRVGIGRYRNQGSMQYQTSVALFGSCGYRPAIPYLVDEDAYDFSLNIVDAAVEDLQVLFPNSPTEFQSMGSMQEYLGDVRD